ncbi:MAG: endolytic transglycosylase MltG [Candidatus Portnoybacteria bacterium]|nr:endolytic transglycosylase MltG [Candidatus Portnoybacteria bacterium]
MKKLLFWSLFSVFILVLAGIFFFSYAFYQIYAPAGNGAGEEKMFEINAGQGVKEIADSLESQGLIRSDYWFEVCVWLEGLEAKFKTGKYFLSPDMSTAKIIQALTEGLTVDENVWVTFPEGFSLKQIEARLVAAGLDGEGLGLEKIGNFQNDFEFLAEAPASASLEGFLFPDTYKFEKDAKLRDITQKMLDNFGEKLTDKMRADIESQGKNIFDIIIMASVVEKEVKAPDERAVVSGIFWERLADKYPLESDATLSYALDDKKDRHSIEETKLDSPYNTYKNIGLPPGPINNPGLEAIEAAVYPRKTAYYFFLTESGTGKAIFAKTLQEHIANKTKYLK